jgi:hypothetical protein
MKKFLLLAIALLGGCVVQAQVVLSGIVKDTAGGALIGVSTVVYVAGDTTATGGIRAVASGITETNGRFAIPVGQPGFYAVRFSYLGYRAVTRSVDMTQRADKDLGIIVLHNSPHVLENVVVKTEALPVQQLGDTTQFNAGSFKTHPNATTEDLITKMPGITSDGNTVKVNGEAVQKVLVDGKPFFGDDPNTALKNLPAEVVDKIQVFDKQSEQSEFTGFNDGNTQKTINIVTHKNKNNGMFGRIYAGYGTDNRYGAGGTVNYFNGATRMSLIGMSNNNNQQNFGSQDLPGLSGGGGRRGGGSSGGMPAPQQSGISRTHSIGGNYSDEWGRKVKISGSYFYNSGNNDNTSDLSRTYITTADSNLVYRQQSSSHSANYNHRFNLRLEYTIDSFNSLVLTPSLSVQNNYSRSDVSGRNMVNIDSLMSSTENHSPANNTGYNFSNNILFRHKFARRGRTFSANILTSANVRNGDGSLFAASRYTLPADSSIQDQQYNLSSGGYTLGATLTYTEPLSEKSRLQFSYAPTYNQNQSDKETYHNDGLGNYTGMDTLYSNKFDNTYVTHRGGINYQMNNSKINFTTGISAQYAGLQGEQYFPYSFALRRSFLNMLPDAMLNYKFSKTENLRINIRTTTNAPSINQLQNVVNNSNPLFLSTGNPDLKQSYTGNLGLRYSKNNPTAGSSFFIFLSGNYVHNYIGNTTYIAQADTQFTENIFLNRGSQLSRPENMEGNWNTGLYLTYGLPVKALKSNLNLTPSLTINHTPTLINGVRNNALNYVLAQGMVLSSNISKDFDFTLSYNGSYTIVQNSLQTRSANNYYTQTTALKLNYIFLGGVVFNTTMNHTLYQGLEAGYALNYLLWNASLGYKFLKNKTLEVSLTVFDILGQNNNVSRTLTETYIEDSRNQVLTRYWMLTAAYSLRNFKGGK